MSGAAHAERSVEVAVGYITSVFEMYKTVSGVEHFHGRVAEIGPGDSCGVGLMFLADGCEKVDLVDRFFSARDEHHQQAINRAITQRFPKLSSLLRNQDSSESSFTNLTRHYGESAAAEAFFRTNRGYDFIVSCAVLEHVYDPMRSLSAMASALNPGGTMLHQVDCQDHGQFSEHFHELKFLELPSSLYSPLKWGGGPNRVRLGSYFQVLRQEALDFTIYIEALAGIKEFLPSCTTMEKIPIPVLDASRRYVSEVRGRLAKPFRDMCDEDLMTTRFVVVARKTGYGNGPERDTRIENA
jgi:SAM-dependent methyltransferase